MGVGQTMYEIRRYTGVNNIETAALLEAPADFAVAVTLCFTPPSSRGVRPHHTSPPQGVEECAAFAAAMVERYATARATAGTAADTRASAIASSGVDVTVDESGDVEAGTWDTGDSVVANTAFGAPVHVR